MEKKFKNTYPSVIKLANLSYDLHLSQAIERLTVAALFTEKVIAEAVSDNNDEAASKLISILEKI